MGERTGHAGADVVAWDGECNGGKYQSGNATESFGTGLAGLDGWG